MKKIIPILILCFTLNTSGPLPMAHAQDLVLPKPNLRVELSPSTNPPLLKGIKVYPKSPFKFDFILDKGDSSKAGISDEELKKEGELLIKYFLASLTIPEEDLWVNLSPYEKDRIVPEAFGQTQMGRDLLAQDYLLKQITASLIYPENEVGKKFWKRIYEEAARRFNTTDIPVNTFNKVWIVPDRATVFENTQAGTAYVLESKLKVMLEVDYLSSNKHDNKGKALDTNQLGSQITREIVLPQLEKEVNEGANFSSLRQVYHSLILAAWYKKKVKDSILTAAYADKNKVQGVQINDPNEKEKIYQQYVQAFKKGVYNYIKQEVDPVTQKRTPKKYFSGGANLNLAMTSQDGSKLDIRSSSTASPAMTSMMERIVGKLPLTALLLTCAVMAATTAAIVLEKQAPIAPISELAKPNTTREWVIKLLTSKEEEVPEAVAALKAKGIGSLARSLTGFFIDKEGYLQVMSQGLSQEDQKTVRKIWDNSQDLVMEWARKERMDITAQELGLQEDEAAFQRIKDHLLQRYQNTYRLISLLEEINPNKTWLIGMNAHKKNIQGMERLLKERNVNSSPQSIAVSIFGLAFTLMAVFMAVALALSPSGQSLNIIDAVLFQRMAKLFVALELDGPLQMLAANNSEEAIKALLKSFRGQDYLYELLINWNDTDLDLNLLMRLAVGITIENKRLSHVLSLLEWNNATPKGRDPSESIVAILNTIKRAEALSPENILDVLNKLYEFDSQWEELQPDREFARYSFAYNVSAYIEKLSDGLTPDNVLEVISQLQEILRLTKKSFSLQMSFAQQLEETTFTQEDILESLLQIKTNLEESDAAMFETKGGIDLNPADIALRTINDGGQIKFYLDPAMLKEFQNAPGFVPVNIKIYPLNDAQGFLGMN